MANNIRDIYAAVLREIGTRRGLKSEILIEAFLDGEYSSGEIKEGHIAEFFSYQGHKRDPIGELRYRGEYNGQHGFYFDPGKKLRKMGMKRIRNLADTISRSEVKDIEVTSDHRIWPLISEKGAKKYEKSIADLNDERARLAEQETKKSNKKKKTKKQSVKKTTQKKKKVSRRAEAVQDTNPQNYTVLASDGSYELSKT